MPTPAQPNVRTLRVGEEMRHALLTVLARGDGGDPLHANDRRGAEHVAERTWAL